MTHVVVVGAGPAGMNAIDTLRELGCDARITLVCDEAPYARMVLPYFMAGEVSEAHLRTADQAYLRSLGVEARLGERVVSVDASSRRLTLESGDTLSYDHLLVATGSQATKPPIEGADAPGVHNLWTLEDARAVVARAPGARVAIIGGGFIAFTCLDAIARHASKVSVIELEPAILPRMMDEAAARLAEAWLAGRGIEIRTGTAVRRIADLDADLVLTATGVRPNVEFLRGSGVQIEQGIVVDERMRTSADGIWAAGDCAQGPDLVTGTREVHAIQTTATDHGRVAAANIAGLDVTYPGSLALNVLEVQGLTLASFGAWQAAGEATVAENPTRPAYRKLIWDGDRLVGAILVGPTQDAGLANDLGMIKGLIQSRASLGRWAGYLRDNPLDLRRAYVGAQVAPILLRQRLLGRPSTHRGYRYPDAQPRRWPAHEVFVRTKPGG